MSTGAPFHILRIRRATPADGPALLPLYAEFHRDLADLVPTEEAFRDALDALLARPRQRFFVAEAGETVTGYAALRDLPEEGGAILDDLYVGPAGRRCGCGRALLEAAVTDASLAGRTSLWLFTAADNPASHALYRTAGFTGCAVADGRTWRYVRKLRPE